MKIKLNTSIDKFYYDVFNIMNNNFLKLKQQELSVISSLYQKNLELLSKIKDEQLRMKILFSKEVKDELCEKLNVSYNSFMNNLSSLRKKDFIRDNKLNSKLFFNPTNFKIEIDVITGV